MKTSLVFALAATSVSARLGFGSCPKIQLQQNFDADRHAGKWYEAKRDKLFAWEMGQECGTQNYRKNASGNYDLYFRAYFWMMAFQYMGVGGELKRCGTSSDWTCQATMGKESEKEYPIDILATDYDNWSVMYACMDMGAMHAKWIGISDRNGAITPDQLAAAEASIAAQLPDFDLSDWSMWNTSQKDCKYDWNTWE